MNKSAIINFLVSLNDDGDLAVDRYNLDFDSKFYKWNKETKESIDKGIDLFWDCKKKFVEYLKTFE